MKITNELLHETAIYVEQYMQDNNDPLLLYHNYTHTRTVVRACDIISLNTDLGKQDRMTVHLAAWFHDIGYFINPAEHEKISAGMAANYFKEKGLDKDTIANIENCILATRIPQQPTTLMEQIICDADFNQLASSEEEYYSSLLRTEFANIKGLEFTDIEWARFNLQFLKTHEYFTAFARSDFEKQKRKNIALIERHLEEMVQSDNKANPGIDYSGNQMDIEKEIKLDRGVETFYKITSGNQIKLNFMADKKANIIISINTLLISIVLSLLAPKVHNNPQFIFPIVLMMVPSVIAILLGVMATRPKIIHSQYAKDPNTKEAAHVMFFGNFSNMSLEEYRVAVKELIYKRDEMYDEISKDIYFQGKVLAKKYKLVAIGYIVFMAGLIVSVIAFLTIFITNAPK